MTTKTISEKIVAALPLPGLNKSGKQKGKQKDRPKNSMFTKCLSAGSAGLSGRAPQCHWHPMELVKSVSFICRSESEKKQ